ncbi:hypothetical protein Pcinc_023276 [Petrolisthes cinctipes]|uniref:Integrase catalytic domain-containing protein n=1 Tax=Petrolisthes cinctipes TaxID=88211 RepID=A0AAE1FC45_PETCI|nr:hypothetical protein Pcinc_023276 [Petrolisthes cinctipes]
MTITGFMGQPKSEDFHIVKPMIKMGRRRKRVTAVVVEELPHVIVVPGLSEVLRDLSSKGFQIAKSKLQGLDPHLEDESELHKLWDLDSIGIDATIPIPDDSVSYQAYLDTVKYEDGQYWIKIMFPCDYTRETTSTRSLEQKIDWDEPLPEHYQDEWKILQTEFEKLSRLNIARLAGMDDKPCSLHVFCDASAKAYGAVAYLVAETKSCLLTSKARVTPVKTRSIPQLELTALLIGTRLASHLQNTLSNLQIKDTHMWSDSEAALQWVRNDQSKLPYVKNRVAEIREIQKDYIFSYTNTNSNPADLLSRGVLVNQLLQNTIWFQGPEWLPEKDQWPQQKPCVVSNISVPEDATPKDNLESFIDMTKFSSLGKLVRVTTKVFTFIKNLYKKRGWNREMYARSPSIILIREVQNQAYAEELKILHSWSRCSPNDQSPESSTKILRSTTRNVCELSKKTLTKYNHYEPSKKILKVNKIIIDLGLYLDDDGIIRCGGRIHNSSLTYGAKNPILIPKDHWFAKLVIRDAHVATLHGGVADTLTYIRRTYWVTKARQSIKTLLRQCIKCRRYDARTIRYPGPPPLPEERVQDSKPFQVVGVDYSGAIQLQNYNEENTGEPKKVYICLFTCATTRAVHLELVTDMSASTFLRAFRRFASRQSCPKVIISDNGSNFRASEPFFKELFKLSEVQQFFESRHCTWKFIAPKSPWQGGFYERMVGVVKRCLRKFYIINVLAQMN